MNKFYRVDDSGYSRKATVTAHVETLSRSISMLFDRYRAVSQANPDLFSLPEGYIECGNELYNLEIMLSKWFKGLHERKKRLYRRVQGLCNRLKGLSGRDHERCGSVHELHDLLERLNGTFSTGIGTISTLHGAFSTGIGTISTLYRTFSTGIGTISTLYRTFPTGIRTISTLYRTFSTGIGSFPNLLGTFSTFNGRIVSYSREGAYSSLSSSSLLPGKMRIAGKK